MLAWVLGGIISLWLFLPRRIGRFLRERLGGGGEASLEGKVVLITGASSGIGRALAMELSARGCRLVLAARNEQALREVSTSCSKKDKADAPAVLPLDLSSSAAAVSAAAARAMEVHGRVDVLVNNGGISVRGAVRDTDVDVHRSIMDVNYFGTVQLTKCILPHMISQKSGHIVNVSSLQGLLAIPDRSAYSASKHAVQAFSDSLRAEVASDGVQVCVVSPGYVRTSISLNALTGSGQKHGVMESELLQGYDPEFVAKRIAEAIVLGEKEVVIAPIHHRAAAILRRLTPWLYFKLMEMRARRNRSKSSP